MRLHRHLLGGLACLMLCAGAPARSHAETPASVLRLIPAEADLLFEIKSPRKIHDLLLQLEVVKELRQFPAIQELYASTQARRFFQLLTYYEKKLGSSYPDILERLTAGGIAVGVKFGPNPAPVLLAIQGQDEKLTAQVSTIALKVLEEELQRQESRDRPEKTTYQNVEVVAIGKGFRMATLGTVILIANQDKALQRGIDLYQGKSRDSLVHSASVKEAYKLLPPEALAAFWLNMETVRKAPGAADAFKTPREPIQTVFFGNYFDVLGRTPSLCGAMAATPDGFLTTLRVPRGRAGMGPELGLHMPLDAKQTGTRPLLEPRGVLYSDSNYLDLGRIWEERSRLFGKDAIKALEAFDKDSSRIPFVKLQLSKLLTEAGAYHRFVAVTQPKAGYTKQPKTAIPAFALVLEMANPVEFPRSIDPVLRGVALFTGGQASLKLVEEKVKGCDLVGYRFPEDRPLNGDPNDTRFAYSPCFVTVGNQFVASSTLELARELIDLLQAEARTKSPPVVATSRVRTYAAGIAESLHLFEDQLITQTILDQAVPVGQAREQVKALIELVGRQGSLGYDVIFTDKAFHFDIRAIRNP